MKYRGKQTINDHRWYYGDIIYHNHAAYIIGQSFNEGEYFSIKVVPGTVTKCIDYIDVNGIDIYVGDIIKIRGFDIRWSEQDEKIYVVETKNGFLSKLTKCAFNIIEVIGNVWDNPELL